MNFFVCACSDTCKKAWKRQLKLNIQVSQVQIADNNDIKKRHGFLPNRQKMSNFKYHQKTYSIPCRYTKLSLFSRISKRFSSSPSTADGNLLVHSSTCLLVHSFISKLQLFFFLNRHLTLVELRGIETEGLDEEIINGIALVRTEVMTLIR